MKHERGFSLIELLVVVAIFSTLLLIVTDIFVNISVGQRRTIAWQKAQADMRYAMEFIAQQVRVGDIAYDYTTYNDGIASPETELAYWTPEKRPQIIRRQTTGCDGGVAGCIEVDSPAYTLSEPLGGSSVGEKIFTAKKSLLTGNSVVITRLDFYISPLKDPYVYDPATKDYLSNNQPRILIVLEGYTAGASEQDKKTIRLQTTVTSRHYER